MDDECGNSLIGVSSATLFGDPLGIRKKPANNANRRGNHLAAHQTKSAISKRMKQQRAMEIEIPSSNVITLSAHEKDLLRLNEKEPWYKRWFDGDSTSCCFMRDKFAPPADGADRPTVRTTPRETHADLLLDVTLPSPTHRPTLTDRDTLSSVNVLSSSGHFTGFREDDRPLAAPQRSLTGLRDEDVSLTSHHPLLESREDGVSLVAPHSSPLGLREEGMSLPTPHHPLPGSREDNMPPLVVPPASTSWESRTRGHAHPREQEQVIQAARQNVSPSQNARTRAAKNDEANNTPVFKWPRWALDVKNPKIEVYVEDGARRKWVSGTPQQQVAAPDGKPFLSVAYQWDGDSFEEDFSPKRVRAIGSTKSLHAEANFLRQMDSATLVGIVME
eukprot:GEMP01052501.1.p1 GENE.GEMP01052501.1~~GEMP01052501.1.p1  ORF type:complete len:389 (+),score=93.47 GEMP01052501.1:64-1230(+)